METYFDTLSNEESLIFGVTDTIPPMQLDFDIVDSFEPHIFKPSPMPDGRWYSLESSRASETEVLVLASMLTMHLTRTDVNAWLLDVESDGDNMAKHGDEWSPPRTGAWNANAMIA